MRSITVAQEDAHDTVRRALLSDTQLAREHDALAPHKSSTGATDDSDIPQRDPQRFGFKGAYPRVQQGDLDTDLIDRLYHEIGIFRNAVDAWSEKTWGDGWNVRTDDSAWKEAAEQLDEQTGIRDALEDLDREVIRSAQGRGFLYFNLASTDTSPSNEPGTVDQVLDIQLVRNRHIDDLEWVDDPEHDDHGEMTRAELVLFGEDTWVHPDRLLLGIENLHPDEHLQGIPRMLAWLQSTLMYENIKWSTGESFFRNASPLLQVQIDEDLAGDLDSDEVDEILNDIDRMQNQQIQRVVADGYEIEVVEGSNNLMSPTAYWNVAVDSLAVDSRVPKHILTGSAAGALKSAEQDEKRFYSRVQDRRTGYPEQLVKDWYRQAALWGLIPSVPEDLVIEWPELDEPTVIEKAEKEKKRAETLEKFDENDLRPPADLTDYEPGDLEELRVQEPDEPDPEPEPMQTPPEDPPTPPRAPQGEIVFVETENGTLTPFRVFTYDHEHEHEHTHGCGHEQDDLGIEISELKPALRRFKNRYEALLLDEQEAWLAALAEHPALDEDQAQEALDPNAAGIQDVLNRELRGEIFEEVLFDLYLDSGEIGGQLAWDELGRDEIFEFVDDTQVRQFRTLAGTTSESLAQRITQDLRRSISEGLTEGDSVREIRNRILDRFDGEQANAARVARTESMRAFNIGSREAFRQAGLEQFRFEAFSAACPVCSPLDGETFGLNESATRPPLHPNCRCVIVPVEEEVVNV